MDWNKLNNSDKQKCPWSGYNNQQPPNLDEVLRKFQEKLGGLFKGVRSKSNGQNSQSVSGMTIGIIIAVLVVIYALSGIYIVRPAEQAAVFTFGKYTHVVGSGPHWIAPFIQSKRLENVERIMASTHMAPMLTRDENIVNIALSVQYKIGNLQDYLFNVLNPVDTMQQATDSAMRQVIGHSTLDDALTDGRQQIRQDILVQLSEVLDDYQAGIQVTDVALQPAEAPQEVRAAFDDAIKAQEDEQRSINEATAYQNRTVPIAQGRAERVLADARAYREQVVLRAEGDATRFLLLLPEYHQAPQVTRDRLYIDAMESVLSESSKVIIDSNSSNNLLYIPLDGIAR